MSGRGRIGGVSPALLGLASGAGNGLRTVLIGHSYLDQEADAYTYNRPILYLQGTVNWMNFFLGWPLEIVKGHAIGGERLIDLSARIDEALREPAELAIWNMGINDLKETKNSGNSRFTGVPYPVDPNQRNLSYCIDLAASLLKRIADKYGKVIIFPETSPANGAGDQNRQLAARAAQYNRALARLAALDGRMVYVPLDRETWDPLSAAGNVRVDPVAGGSYYRDFIHPGNVAAYWRGKFAASYVAGSLRKFDRLPTNVFETYTNLKVVGTSLSSVATGVVRVLCPNVTNGFHLIREGDMVSLAVPTAGQEAWGGRWSCIGATATYIDVACGATGSFTGTVNLSSAEQLYDNPLIATQTGGASSGGGIVTGAMPAQTSLSIPTGCTATVTYPVHTDLAGVADGLGYWLDIDFALAANQVAYLWFQMHRSSVASSFHGRVHPGDVVQAGADIEVLGNPVNLRSFDFGMTIQYTPPAASQVQIPVLTMYRDGANTDAHPNRAARGSLMTGEWQVPTIGVLDTLDGQLMLVAGALACTVRVRIGRVGVYAKRAPLRNAADTYAI